MTATQPTPADQFTFGLWTVGWQARDPFGDADPRSARPGRVRAPARRARRLRRDVPRRRPGPARRVRRPTARRRSTGSPTALDETGLIVPMMTTNLFTHPVFKDGGFTSNDRSVRRYALRKVMRNSTWRPSSARRPTSCGVAARAPSTTWRRTCGPRSTATARPSTRSPTTCCHRGYDIRFALEPKPNEPRGDILLPTVGHALAFIASLEHHEMVGLNPEVGHEQMAGLNFVHGIAAGAVARQAVPHRPQRPAQHQVRPGPGLRSRRPAERVRPGRPAGVRRPGGRPGLRRPAALRLQAVPHRGHRRRLGVGGREHAHVPAAQGAGGGVPRRPRGAGRAGRERCAGAVHADAGAGRDRRRPRWPTAARTRTSTSTRPARAGSASSTSTSSRSSTCSTRDDGQRDEDGAHDARRRGRLVDAVVQGGHPRRRLRRARALRVGAAPGRHRGRARRPGGRRCIAAIDAGRRPRRRGGGVGRGAAARHGLPRRRRRGRAAGAAVERHPLGRGARDDLVDELGGPEPWATATGSVPVASFTVTKLRWLAEHEPASMARTAAVCLPHDWLTWRLAGATALSIAGHRPQRRQRHRLLVAGRRTRTGPTC